MVRIVFSRCARKNDFWGDFYLETDESTISGIESTFSVIESTFFRFSQGLVNFFWQGVLSEFSRSSLGRQSVVARWNEARYKRREENGNLNKKHILVVGRSLVHPWFVLGFSFVFYTEYIYKVQGKWILIFVLFSERPIGYYLVFRGMEFLAYVYRE